MVYSTAFLLIPACWLWVVPHFIKKVKAHKARQKLETLNKAKARKARKKVKARRARRARTKNKVLKGYKKGRHISHVKR